MSQLTDHLPVAPVLLIPASIIVIVPDHSDGTATAIPQRVLPVMDKTVVATERAVPDDVSRRPVQFRDVVTSTPPTARTAPARHIRVLVAVRRVVRDPGHDGAEEDGQTQNTFRYGFREVTSLFVDVMPHVHEPAGWFDHALMPE